MVITSTLEKEPTLLVAVGEGGGGDWRQDFNTVKPPKGRSQIVDTIYFRFRFWFRCYTVLFRLQNSPRKLARIFHEEIEFLPGQLFNIQYSCMYGLVQ